MAEENAGTGAKDEGTDEQEEQNPFAGFQTEGYKEGERTDDADGGEPADKEEPSATGGAAKEDDADDDDDSGEDDDEGEKEAGEKPKKKSAQGRISELTRLRHEERRRAEAAERRLQELEDRLRASADDDEEDAEKKPAAKADAKDDGKKEPSPDDFEFGELDSRYIRALSRYEARQEWESLEAKRAEKAQQDELVAAARASQEKFAEKIEAGKAKYEDFEERVILGAERNEWPLSRELGEMIAESDVGADIAYHLAANPDEAALVYRQTPLEQARYFGRMESMFSAEQTAATGGKPKESVKPKAPKAPAPPDRARGRGGQHKPGADTEDFAAFERVAMESLNNG